jgi:hypothetical protein
MAKQSVAVGSINLDLAAGAARIPIPILPKNSIGQPLVKLAGIYGCDVLDQTSRGERRQASRPLNRSATRWYRLSTARKNSSIPVVSRVTSWVAKSVAIALLILRALLGF